MGTTESSEAFDTVTPQTAPNMRPVWDRNTTEAEMRVIKKQHVIRSSGSYGTIANPNATNGKAAAMEPSFFIWHHVSEHDTIAGIALRYGVIESMLRKTNPLIPADPSVQHLKTMTIPVTKANAAIFLNATKDKFPPPTKPANGGPETPSGDGEAAGPSPPPDPPTPTPTQETNAKEKGKKSAKESERMKRAEPEPAPQLPQAEILHSDSFVDFTAEGIVLHNCFFPNFGPKSIPYSSVECWQPNTLLQLNGAYLIAGGYFPTATRTLATLSSRYNKCFLMRESGSSQLIVLPAPASFDASVVLTKHCGAPTV